MTVHQALAALSIYGDLAGSETLTRALVAERTGSLDQAAFWIDVYQELCHERAGSEEPPDHS
ncbi:hypothetical protein [Rhizobium sp. LC145]|uniref:hypothetical protein n=1 Tax=Rhizobium sp. LC145 TaxID=1120688 RepID=UPI000629E621|nr:hypothetical protein [Rhizobium sp. LC145]KKX34069.1 hypothetical protein YH62_02550 [Rhizobium sp. LC145]TKT66960.1 hypothetical protein FDR95_04590 [Rhizobiaceae bacterium LC148]